MPPNAIRTPDGGWITATTKDENGKNLTIHVESGVTQNPNGSTIPVPPSFPILSPLKQLKSGILAKDLQCRQGLVLIKNLHTDSVACVKPVTAQKLVERGWGTIVTSPIPIPTSCPTGKTMVNGQCVTGIVPPITITETCIGDTLIPFSYALPCIISAPTCPIHMKYSNGMCTTTPPFIPNSGLAYPNCGGGFNGNICEPNFTNCPIGLQRDPNGTTCNYSQPKCSAGYGVIQISAGSYLCQPANPPPLSNATSYFAGQKAGVFTISTINPYNVTGYYNNPYPLARPGPGYFTILHVGDTLNPTCDGSAPLVITAINYPDSIAVSIGKSAGRPYGSCPICLSANSEIKTPNGDVNVKDVKDGMVVWSTDSNGIIIKSKIIRINNVFVGDTHKVIDLQLADGRELFVSPNHPTYDNRIIAELKVGETYDGSTITSMELVPYKYQFTYDILPDSQTGNYFANGILVGSTLK